MNHPALISKRIIVILCYLIAIALSIKSFREPDLWWQICTGQWILQHHAVPHQDVFSFTFNGVPWINIKWGFEVLAAIVSNALGPESVFIIQAIVSCLILYFLLKRSKLFLEGISGANDANNERIYLFSTVIALLVTFIGVEYRMIGRPEMISHLMTVVFLYILEKNKKNLRHGTDSSGRTSKIIYLIIPLQIVWVNFHEAFGIGLVILLIYTASAWADKLFFQKNNDINRKHLQLTFITLAAIASVAINPNGVKLITSPFTIMSQVHSNKYTTELLNFTAHAWWQKEAWIGLFIFGISFIGLFFRASTDVKKNKGSWSIANALDKKAYLITILAFLYLGLTAYRNLIFLSLVCFPAFHSSLFLIFKKWVHRFSGFKKISVVVSVSLLSCFYVLVVSNKYYTLSKSRDRFGLEILSNFNPVGAANFISENNLQKKKCFADYLTSSYLLWKFQPDFKTFIDLRDLDVFPPEFFDKFFNAVNYPQQFHSIDSVEHFDYVVLYQGQFPALHSYLYNDTIYALTYIDAVAAVYEKTDDFTRDDIFSRCQPVKPGAFAMFINKTLNPFYHSFSYTDLETDYMAGSYYLSISHPDLATKRAEKCIANKKMAFRGYELLGQINYNYSLDPSNSKERKEEFLNTSEQNYLASLRIRKDYGRALLGLGVISYSRGNYPAAINYFERCEQDAEAGEQAKLFKEECEKAIRQ